VTYRSEIQPTKDPEGFRKCSTSELPANHPVNTAPSGHTSGRRAPIMQAYCHNTTTDALSVAHQKASKQ